MRRGEEKSIIMNLTGVESHSLRASKKKTVSSSFSPETKAPAIGLFFTVSVAINKPFFKAPCFGRFFLIALI